MSIKLNQIYKQKGHEFYIVISSKKGSKWGAKVLTNKPGVYKGSHSMNEYTLKAKYELVS